MKRLYIQICFDTKYSMEGEFILPHSEISNKDTKHFMKFVRNVFAPLFLFQKKKIS